MEELLTLDNVEDPTLTAALARGRFSIMLTVDEDLPENAAVVGMAAIRTAFHAAGAATPYAGTASDMRAHGNAPRGHRTTRRGDVVVGAWPAGMRARAVSRPV
jgi:hypothetical protein